MSVQDIEQTYQELLDQQTSEEYVREGTSFATVPSGSYRLEVTKKEVRTAYKPDPNTGAQKPDRFRVHCTGAVYDLENGKKVGTVFFDASPIEARTDSGKLDTASRLWGHLYKAHSANGHRPTNREVIERLDAFPYKAYITEAFRKADGSLTTPQSAEEKQELVESGAESINFVRSLGAFA